MIEGLEVKYTGEEIKPEARKDCDLAKPVDRGQRR